MRLSKNVGAQKVKGKEEELVVSFHGVAYVDLAPLLYPGVSKIHGAFMVQPFNETEMMEKFNLKTIFTEDIVKTMIGAQRSNSGLGGGKNAGKKTDAKAKVWMTQYVINTESASYIQIIIIYDNSTAIIY